MRIILYFKYANWANATLIYIYKKNQEHQISRHSDIPCCKIMIVAMLCYAVLKLHLTRLQKCYPEKPIILLFIYLVLSVINRLHYNFLVKNRVLTFVFTTLEPPQYSQDSDVKCYLSSADQRFTPHWTPWHFWRSDGKKKIVFFQLQTLSLLEIY